MAYPESYSFSCKRPYRQPDTLTKAHDTNGKIQHLIRTVAMLAATASLYSCSLVRAEQTNINCTLPHTDNRMQECTIVKRASEFNSCLKSSDISEHTCVLMDADVSFCDSNQVLNMSAIFDSSNKSLNCKGGTIDHGWSKQSSDTVSPTRRDRQMPYVRLFDDRSLSNLSIKNCTMRGTFHAGIQMTRFFGGELGGDGKLDKNEALPVGHNNILIENINIESGSSIGIYLGNFSEDITMNRVHVDGTRRIAVYSEAGSHRIKITNSIISNNQSREAVAIDSTYNSEISNTRFLNNREGGINVYQNCGELKGQVCPVIRSTPPNGNKITNNTFINNGITGIQIASRQGRNHAFGWCASLGGLPGKFTDTATNNVLTGNTIHCDEGTAMVLMDGPNIVRNNNIVATQNCVPLEISTGGFSGSKSHLLDGLVVEDNDIQSNRAPRLRNVGQNVILNNRLNQ